MKSLVSKRLSASEQRPEDGPHQPVFDRLHLHDLQGCGVWSGNRITPPRVSFARAEDIHVALLCFYFSVSRSTAVMCSADVGKRIGISWILQICLSRWCTVLSRFSAFMTEESESSRVSVRDLIHHRAVRMQSEEWHAQITQTLKLLLNKQRFHIIHIIG